MRIFCAVRHSIDPLRYYGGLWSANFYPALKEMGHEIVESQTDLLPTSRFMDIPGNFTREELDARSRTTERIMREVRAAHSRTPIDLFLSYFYNAHFDPAGFDELRRMGIPSVNFYCNNTHQFELVRELAAKADFAWHSEKEARQAYLDVGANPVWVQLAADPSLYSPVLGATRIPKACFVGQRYADRDRWLALLIRSGVPVELYGSGWDGGADPSQPEIGGTQTDYLGRRRIVPGSWQSYWETARRHVRQMGFVPGTLHVARQFQHKRETRACSAVLQRSARGRAAEISSVFAQHEVCLNFSNVWADGKPGSPMLRQVHLRDFEGPMCRTCYLTGHTEEITHFYDVGREIETYRSPAELVEKVRFYLQRPDAAEKLREAGYRRALSDHTWRRRFEELFRKIGLAGRSSG